MRPACSSDYVLRQLILYRKTLLKQQWQQQLDWNNHLSLTSLLSSLLSQRKISGYTVSCPTEKAVVKKLSPVSLKSWIMPTSMWADYMHMVIQLFTCLPCSFPSLNVNQTSQEKCVSSHQHAENTTWEFMLLSAPPLLCIWSRDLAMQNPSSLGSAWNNQTNSSRVWVSQTSLDTSCC